MIRLSKLSLRWVWLPPDQVHSCHFPGHLSSFFLGDITRKGPPWHDLPDWTGRPLHCYRQVLELKCLSTVFTCQACRWCWSSLSPASSPRPLWHWGGERKTKWGRKRSDSLRETQTAYFCIQMSQIYERAAQKLRQKLWVVRSPFLQLVLLLKVTEEGSTKLFRTTVGGELWPAELTSTLQWAIEHFKEPIK